MSTNPQPLVAVMGVSGVGKSTVGELLAARLGVEYVDGDDLHPPANRASMRAGKPLTEEQRRPWLEAVGAWLRAHAAAGGVVSCSALRHAHRQVLSAAAPGVVYLHLTGDPELIRERMGNRRHHFMPAALLDSQLATLEPPGSGERHATFDVGLSPEEIVDRFLADTWPRSVTGRGG